MSPLQMIKNQQLEVKFAYLYNLVGKELKAYVVVAPHETWMSMSLCCAAMYAVSSNHTFSSLGPSSY